MKMAKTTWDRYIMRKKDWGDVFPNTGWMRHKFHWILHNCIVHVLIGLFPSKIICKLHDWSSIELNKYS